MRTHAKPLHANVSRVVRSLTAARGIEQQDVAEAIGVQQPALSKRLGGYTDWALEDIAALARFFDVSEAIFFADADDLFTAVDASAVRRAPITALATRQASRARSRCFLCSARRPLPDGRLSGAVAAA